MKASGSYMTSAVVMMATLALLFVSVFAAPMESEDEQSENSLVHAESDGGLSAPWDAIDAAALRKLLIQLDAEDRMGRVSRSWPPAEPRGWGLRTADGRLARQWRADKRQVRFRQCYFNPISCFRK
ncbi:hypothetical protein ABMA28_016912 [Loxostege sticticalis]|uniref:Allatostatin C n=1 Tax=Loxostege sticticalis TaxID=481309 RepID=A0ABD0T6B2_LOXSC